ncbi:MAG TPA: signal recognition particle protein [bacterium]|nr:signal recognition particle protein [bacterium]
MFEGLSDKLSSAFKQLRGHGKLTERNIEDTLKEIRKSLLEADVNYNVVKRFLADVKQKSLGKEVMESLTPGQHFVKLFFRELVTLMGEQWEDLNLKAAPPAVIMLVGLQGSGKTTTAGKIALYLRDQRKRSPFLVPADVYRPAAIEQLQVLAGKLGVPAFASTTEMDPVEISAQAVDQARKQALDTVIIDTAGRLHIDEALMDELRRIKERTRPVEVLLVADAMTGQDAVTVAESFNAAVEITGVVLTKLDGDARGGAALSIKAVTGKPIKLVGVGEKLEALEAFHPERMASRILEMGDILTLIERAERTVDQKKAHEMQRKMRRSEFTLEDFRDALHELKKMGPLEDVLKMIPGVGKQLKKIQNMQPAEDELKRIEAIINSMTGKERRNHKILNGSRRRRIAAGSGTQVQDVNRLIKDYQEMQKLMKQMTSAKGGMSLPGIGRFM